MRGRGIEEGKVVTGSERWSQRRKAVKFQLPYPKVRLVVQTLVMAVRAFNL